MSVLLLNKSQQRKMYRYFTDEGVERVICPQEGIETLSRECVPTKMYIELNVEGEPKPLLNGHVQEFMGMPTVGQLDRLATMIMYESDGVSTASYKAGVALLERLFRRTYFKKYLEEYVSVSGEMVDGEWIIKISLNITDENPFYISLIKTFKPLVVFFRDDIVYVKPICEITPEEAQTSILSEISQVLHLYNKDVENLPSLGIDVDKKVVIDRTAFINYRIYMKSIVKDILTMDEFRQLLVDELHQLTEHHKTISFGGQEEMEMILLVTSTSSDLHHTPMKVNDDLTFGKIHRQEMSLSLKPKY